MTVSLDSPLSGGAGEGRQRLQRAAARAVGFIGKMARNPLTAIGGGIIFMLLVVAIFAPLIAPYNPLVQDLNSALVAPNAQHWFGTDEFGRDIFSRLVYGSRITLYIVLLVSVTVGPLGLLLGVSAGYFGGKVDMVLMRVTDIFISFPSLVLALAFVAALGPGLEHVVIAITLTAWPPIARLARAETLSLRQADFISAVRLQGASSARVLWRHIVPLCLPSVIIRITMNMAGIILTAAGLGFLGLGAQPPEPEWGAMISSGRTYMMECWWVVTIPGLAILINSLAFNFLGDGLRDILDIVGESGSGKSTVGRALLQLHPKKARVSASRMQFADLDLQHLSEAQMRGVRGKRISMIMQDPKYSLNPVVCVGKQIAEAWLTHHPGRKDEAKARALEMLEVVRIRQPERVYQLYPHEISGGQGQRIMIAMMLITDPELIIADEPTSALDVSVRLQVLGLLDDLVQSRGLGLIFISHDINLVRSFCDRVLVMYAGRVVESIAAKDLDNARHPYTQGLINSLPDMQHRRPILPVLQRQASWLTD
ncbi:MAG: dipeptide/oligopeptide/nickel ABC transporter permease/ATP-binding protein [Klebsiella pneumoniae]|nr:dipeptide/oligopeptide/nickel ABC transporter permease/ATP-binding protein [Klebsiella pneumoniae]